MLPVVANCVLHEAVQQQGRLPRQQQGAKGPSFERQIRGKERKQSYGYCPTS